MNEFLPNLIEGAAVMAIGLGVVITFLTIMIFAMGIMSAIIKQLNKIFPEAVPAMNTAKKVASGGDEDLIAAAIACIKSKF